MAEPEGLLIDGARHGAVFINRLWRRLGHERDNGHSLDTHKQRLEWVLLALHGGELTVHAAQPPAPRTALSRLLGRTPPHLADTRALPASDGLRVYLPPQLDCSEPFPLQLFLVLALQQLARAQRRSLCVKAAKVAEPADSDALPRDLFSLSEAAAVDRELAEAFPGLTGSLVALRRAALSDRPEAAVLTAPERRVEEFYRRVLEARPSLVPSPFPVARTAADSLDWAAAAAREIAPTGQGGSSGRRAKAATGRQGYRGLRASLWLGRILPVPAPGERQESAAARYEADTANRDAAGPAKSATLPRRPDIRKKKPDEDDQEPGMWMVQMDDPQQHVEDPLGMQRPADREGDADAGDLADSLSELPEARLVSSPSPAREVLLSDQPLERRAISAEPAQLPVAIAYPEWDYRASAYIQQGACIRLQTPAEGDPAWAGAVLAERQALLRQIQRRFEGMRPHRIRTGRQCDGEDIDISACVDAFAERRAGLPLTERLYQAVKPARRDFAIALLIDISASTDGWVSRDQRIIDVEKEALLLVYRALTALGDAFCMQAFSGEGAQNVMLWPLKSFEETDGNLIQRRIAALEPQHYTRAGTAMRHAGAMLAAHPAKHRLLILLSDGKPNDIDHYEGRYGVEDMRQAVAESALQSVSPFCITVDRQAPRYLASVFGRQRYVVLQHPGALPLVLVEMLRNLVKT